MGALCRTLRRAAAPVAIGAALSLPAAAAATTFTWSGNGGTWSNPASWQGAVAPPPQSGEVDLAFPPAACGPQDCAATSDDIPGLVVRRLTLGNRVISYAPRSPFEGPPPLPEPQPASYSVEGSTPLELTTGLDVETVVEGRRGAGEAATPLRFAPPIVLGGNNHWAFDTDAALSLLGGISAPTTDSLAIDLAGADTLVMPPRTEAGPVSIRSKGPGSYVYIGGAGAPADLNGADGQSVSVTGAWLAASGSLGDLHVSEGTLHVGYPGSAGILDVRGALAFQSPATIELTLPAAAAFSTPAIYATGRVDLGSAALRLDEGCVTPGAETTFIASETHLAGTLTAANGAAIANGQVIAPSGGGCEGRPAVDPIAIEYGPYGVDATILAPPTPPAPPGGPHRSVPGGTTGGPAARVRAGIAGDIALERGVPWSLSALRHGFLVRAFAPTAGTLAVSWWCYVPVHAHGRLVQRRELVAFGSHRFARAGTATVRLRLTRDGAALVRRSRGVHVLASLAFTAPGVAPVAVTGTLKLHR
jgi:hypothetical protein